MNQNRLKELLSYDPGTGEFVRLKTGIACLGVTGEGYRRVFLDGHNYRAGRLAWLYIFGEWPNPLIDHINGVVDDDRICNLRVATKSQNAANAKTRNGLPKGVSLSCRKDIPNKPYTSQVMCEGHAYRLGYFETIEEAKTAYDRKQVELFGEFAKS